MGEALVIFNGRSVRREQPPADLTAGQLAQWEAESGRKEGIYTRRLYYAGEQYEAENRERAEACMGKPLPEHERLHAYSTQIQECVDFIADQVAERFAVNADDSATEAALVSAFLATDVLNGGDGETLVVDDLLKEALQAGDVPYEARWDPIRGTVFLEYWDSEEVGFEVPYGQHVAAVTRSVRRWVKVDGDETEVTEHARYDLAMNPDTGREECRKTIRYDSTPEPAGAPEWLGLPFIPWGIMRADRKGVRDFRGESVITPQAMSTADRYNAVEATSWLIARYNSHANLVVTGDGAAATFAAQNRPSLDEAPPAIIQKDIADVLSFPGGTSATVITLPTDPQMIEHQRKVTGDALYALFGLVRVEPDTIGGLGQMSGYALEIINRKSEGTFARVRRMLRKDWITKCNMILNVWAYNDPDRAFEADDAVPDDLDGTDEMDPEDPEWTEPEGVGPVDWWTIDPLEVFPNRDITIEMGSGYVVDEVGIRDDFTAGLISRQGANRAKGMDDDDIARNEREIRAEQEAATASEGTAGGPDLVVPGTQGGQLSAVGRSLRTTEPV